MKVIAILGSCRPQSRSLAVAEQMIAGARAAGHEVKVYRMSEMPLLGCQSCMSCRKNNVDCVLNDALSSYWKDLHESGALILTAPNFNSQPSGAMITFMNRHYCMLDLEKKPRLDHDVKLLSVFAQGAPESHEAYKKNYQWYLNCFRAKRILDSGMLVVGGDSDISPESELMKRAYRMGAEL